MGQGVDTDESRRQAVDQSGRLEVSAVLTCSQNEAHRSRIPQPALERGRGVAFRKLVYCLGSRSQAGE